MKILTEQQLEAFFKTAESEYDVRVPIKLHDGTRSLGKLGEGPLALAGGVVPQKITNVFFPQIETVLTIGPDGVELQESPAKPLLIVGFTAQDADCLEFIDRFYGENYRDDIYFNKRESAVIVCVSGRCGADGEFLKIAGEKCDMELICDGQKYLLAGYTKAGESLLEKAPTKEQASEKIFKELQKESDALAADDLELIQTASKLLLDEKVPEEFWRSISDRCIACTSCNLACPTCTCFEVFDRKADGNVQRRRMWDSCQLDGFMREASGHNPMGEERIRTRRRIHHKLAADVTRWGHLTCYLCGRCDQVCPTGIGIKAVCGEMVEQYGSK
ncbi:MAG TPA: 4Fe-4S dicluster domain-containing protein [Sedimentisphaerales bacterium]|nr:4Fe-4S dicluster domain-containing protein [Sedimentisphaerales bacterium]